MQLDKNPFERPSREFPVDFAYPFTRTYIADIAVPEGYTVGDLPESRRLTIPSGTVSYTRVVSTDMGRIQLRAVLNVAASQVSPEEYGALRALYDEIVASESEAIVVTRAAAEAVGSSSLEDESAASPDASDQ